MDPIQEWVAKARKAGYPDDNIRAALAKAGHSPGEIAFALNPSADYRNQQPAEARTGAMHDIGLAGRAGVEGIAGLPLLAAGGISKATGHDFTAPSKWFNRLLDRAAASGWGLDAPQTENEATAVALGSGAVGGLLGGAAGLGGALPGLAAGVTGAGSAEVGRRAFDITNPWGLAGIGLLGGVLGAGATGALLQAPRVPQALAATAAEHGVDMLPGQVMGGVPGRLEELTQAMTDKARLQTQAGQVREAIQNSPKTLTGGEASGDAVIEGLRNAYKSAKARVGAKYDVAEAAAQGHDIPVPAFEKAIGDLQNNASEASLFEGIDKYIPTGEKTMTYAQLREVSKSLYAKLKQAERQSISGGINDIQLGALKKAYGALQDDINSWAQANPEAGLPHLQANAAFRAQVAPFREVPLIRRAVTKGYSDMGQDIEAFNFVPRVIGGNPAKAALLKHLLTGNGEEAAQAALEASLIEPAAKGATAGAEGANPAAFVRGVNPAVAEAAMTPGTLARLKSFNALMDKLKGVAGAHQQPPTGYQALRFAPWLEAGHAAPTGHPGAALGAFAAPYLAEPATNLFLRGLLRRPTLPQVAGGAAIGMGSGQ